ncbi:ABC transporter ATP-binding protein [Desulfosporosinus sp. Sb-LF]|uniref:ABC transporter ATP-binding protein n=1 Tax=Desulfosporosinus sp. Sb-LF TaxID=2560027 RepID=UPI00107F12AC|nr:ABC transporter ATP-binding protein [Desulfosporosinus sp. Sb-LF]TGE32354.1 ABC transporter ATP-binding protein [Desulfosporosinus sp. Sb-LF]
MGHLLEVKDLCTSFFTYAGEVKAVDGVSFYLDQGEAIGIVGESGCGKSITVQSIMRLIPNPPGKIIGGSVNFIGVDLLKKSEKQMESIRGKDISMIFQDPMTSLNPVLTVGLQLTEVLKRHEGLTGKVAKDRAVELLELVGISNPESRLKQYPHQFSGGMRQRVMIALALACNPKLLIADEPTTALDVTIQAQILELMQDLKSKINTSIIMITHDLGVVAGLCSRVIVMYGGKIVESGSTNDIYYNPKHPYTWGLLKSVPRLDADKNTKLIPIPGTPIDLLNSPKGCRFAPRCSHCMRICTEQTPEYTQLGEGHQVACWLQHPQAPKVAELEGRV